MAIVKTDRRSIRTRKAIRNAFAQLFSEKGFAAFTISDLTERANINRKTFYNYYPSLKVLAEEITSEITEGFVSLLSEIDFDKPRPDFKAFATKLTTYLHEESELFKNLFSSEHHLSFMNRLTPSLKARAKALLMPRTDAQEDDIDYAIDYSITGFIAVLQSWLKSEHKKSPAEIAAILEGMLNGGFASLMHKN
ncbi:MAG: TetR/AcrR family transcriptional regulator [Lachnospiraceae bacterium]|nr:TetR/AcrR family transcriptional regulator [Lachnospiraceae bacterium]